MPFKLKLKKTRQYNVASKSLFVISVELLDGGVADCTLSVDSTGQECLENVCQRQAINQPEFFGLRYINRNQQPRWVQLERPLKRQLDKYASSHQLYLRVMYYVVSGTSLITDEVTRYHYFLQLKNDLVEGRIICDCQQAVVLASYSRQAEYGNHDRERHTVEYLKNLLTFPKQMIDGGQIIESSSLAESGKLEWLTSAVIQHHMTLHNMSQAQAEEGFISACQLLRGYGQEMFVAQDQLKQNEVTIAISLNGIMVLPENSDTPHFYRWMDITNVINHKRTFSIECATPSDSSSFVLRDPELGKYVWRVCVQQHTFYMKHQAAAKETQHLTTFQEVGLSQSRSELEPSSGQLSAGHRAHSTSCLDLQHQGHRRSNGALVPSYRPAPDYETAIQQKYQQQRAEAQRYQGHHSHSQMLPGKPYGSHPDIHRVHYPDVTRHTSQGLGDDFYGLKYMGHNSYPAFAVNPNVQTELNSQLQYINVYKPPPPYPSNGLASNSTPDLAVASQALNYHRGYINSHVSGSSPDLVSTRSALNRQFLGYVNPVNVVNYSQQHLPSTHGTYNNLASVLEPNTHIIMDPHHISDNIQKVYDERGNIMYSMPMHRVPYQRQLVMQQSQPIPKVTDSHEPIYENVPLPWQNENKSTIRDRAQSLTTTDEIARLNERNSSHPAINYTNLTKPQLNMPSSSSITDNHYVNAQIIKGVRESSLPKDIAVSTKSINKERDSEFENVKLSIERLDLNKDEKEYDETPYQSLSTHRVNDNVTSITVPDGKRTFSDYNSNVSQSSGVDSGVTNSTINTTYSTSLELDSSNTTKNSSVSSKEKKRRRWGVFMGRGKEVKSATLGRDKAKSKDAQNNKHRWSTGLPRFQPLPPSITKETLCQLLERKMSDGQLQFEFEQIPKGRETNAEMTTALLAENAVHNGYQTDSLPYEDNRVKLVPTPANRHGYVNASHITMTVGSSQRFYVYSAASFGSSGAGGGAGSGAGGVWRAALAAGARVVVYVGSGPPAEVHGDYGDLSVHPVSSSLSAWGGAWRVRVTSPPREKLLWLVTYHKWTTDQTLDTQQFLEFLSEVSCLRASGGAGLVGGANAPGVWAGRGGGAALAADLLLHIIDNNQELDIPRTVGLLHQQRANLVPSAAQYRALHQLLLHYLRQSRLI